MNKILALSGCTDYPKDLAGENQYLSWQWLEEGILKIEPCFEATDQVLISTGIHGNETAPIEIVAQIVCQLLNGELPLKVNLLLVFGNIKAIAEGQRYLDADLNRMFNGRHINYPGTAESKRAAEIEQDVERFFAQQDRQGQRFHFDLHTAIRGSHYQKFGLLPQQIKTQHASYLNWLVSMGLQALVVNLIPSGTFSSFTSNQCEATSCTLELGKAKPFGENDLANFSEIQEALINLISGIEIQDATTDKPVVYIVEQELIKFSDQFKFIAVDDSVENFTRYTKDTLIATDNSVNYQVKNDSEWILFPNPLVKNGLRAGILLAQGDTENLFVDEVHGCAS